MSDRNPFERIVLKHGESVEIEVEGGGRIAVRAFSTHAGPDQDARQGITLIPLDCDLEGEEPGTYETHVLTPEQVAERLEQRAGNFGLTRAPGESDADFYDRLINRAYGEVS